MGKRVTDARLLEALLVHGGASGAAVVLGISKNAIYKRLQDEGFRQQYDTMQGVLLSTAAAEMTDTLGDAVTMLRGIVNDPEVSAGTRVSAADSLLRHCARYVELTAIVSRLDALEATLKGVEESR